MNKEREELTHKAVEKIGSLIGDFTHTEAIAVLTSMVMVLSRDLVLFNKETFEQEDADKFTKAFSETMKQLIGETRTLN